MPHNCVNHQFKKIECNTKKHFALKRTKTTQFKKLENSNRFAKFSKNFDQLFIELIIELENLKNAKFQFIPFRSAF